jgi:site-specific recombinase XerD
LAKAEFKRCSVFTGIPGEPKYYEAAGIKKKASVHTLRHTFATHQIHNGLKINQLKEVLGHRQMETTYKYIHLDRTNLKAEMENGAL